VFECANARQTPLGSIEAQISVDALRNSLARAYAGGRRGPMGISCSMCRKLLESRLFSMDDSPRFLCGYGWSCSSSARFSTLSNRRTATICLVEKGYIPYPQVDIEIIRDKNKADGFARAVMLIQISWFSIQCIGRAIQHLSLSTFELSTVASIFCAVNALYFWYYELFDFEILIYL